MLVDDSAVVRGFIGRILETDPGIKIVASVANGEQGVTSAARHHPDIVILDIEMPVMDGITALPKILAASPGVRVVMCSTLSVRNAEITLKAFSLGATECIAKPSNSISITAADDFKQEVIRVVKSLGRRKDAGSLNRPATTSTPLAAGTYSGGQNTALKQKTAFELRKHMPGEMFRPQLLAIGSSTGGPQALFKTIASFKNFDVPIILTQHMPATFTKILAQHITQHTGVEALEGENGMIVENGKVYVAPGGFHMTFERVGTQIKIVLDSGPQENYCKPSVDPMLRSALKIWGGKIMTVILTGMGSDGLPGSKMVVEQGGRVVAQDQETSVVWGMPGAVATNGLCTAVLPLQDIGPYVRQAFGKV
ncbi:MAG: chemotaxis response regulator protein-glutamate methylesterase [Micavibrio aeruginosavorus]|uniref:Protein-glutamate methylesterase/protein-glutamine glutaminase n=1 Tax=Micavibrio aeruginosavorus TaxID=349221 RepID=A0A2W5Q6B3_9BACT|nr:MAG: chemotaxis response regulator protein-glutamate methylesterase [Micavibrio aeruginosavorus]